MHESYAARVRPFLQDGEEIETAENVVCVATGRGAVGGLNGVLGDRLARIGAVSGERDSTARSIQIFARFRLHFADGSTTALLAPNARPSTVWPICSVAERRRYLPIACRLARLIGRWPDR